MCRMRPGVAFQQECSVCLPPMHRVCLLSKRMNKQTKNASGLDPAKGGRARAAKLTREERSKIARQAAMARWRDAEVVQATHVGSIKLGDIELACANLPDERRVISEAAMLTALGRGYSGYYSQRDAAAKPGTAVPPRYLSPKALQPLCVRGARGIAVGAVRLSKRGYGCQRSRRRSYPSYL